MLKYGPAFDLMASKETSLNTASLCPKHIFDTNSHYLRVNSRLGVHYRELMDDREARTHAQPPPKSINYLIIDTSKGIKGPMA